MPTVSGAAPHELAPYIDQIQAAAAAKAPIAIRGGATKDALGGPIEGAPLDMRNFAGVISYEPSELVVTVRAGTLLAELEALLAQHGQCLAFEPPRLDAVSDEAALQGTVGGMVAAGLSGPSRASVGSVRDYVLGAAMLNGRGEHLVFGGQVMKNVAGYDVSRVLAGSMGVLGVITELSLKVLPVAPAEATLAFACTQTEALRRLNQWGGLPLPLNASCWGEQDGQGWLLLRLRGAVAAVDAACRQLGGVRAEAEQAQASWTALRDMQLPFFRLSQEQELWRASVPQTAPALAFDAAAPLVEWHGAQRWYVLQRGQGHRLQGLARAVGGNATRFAQSADAPAQDSPSLDLDAVSAPVRRIHESLKRTFDPQGIFNRGRLLGGL
ncbi:glycolate oxidase subunit GlcE [Variovorax dokdonensis]|uniref:Glycolate oxidase subunit GlcE n=1 Tax=Variovorax dokdonensis TaxID=344883 RepID=A0ABT7NF91_9BURK|nr:glycolate oxidase subunit GlcE [Variovorax dokdonensis]MDM0046620.1 glycolate oxidase subunit GlcE [Variovorax dokdonensis]